MAEFKIKEENYLGFDLLGKTSGKFKTRCVFCSDTKTDPIKKKEKCVSIDMETGCYTCHRCGQSGSIHKWERTDKPEPVKVYSKPKWENKTELPNKIVEYWEGRKISQRTLKDIGITYGREWMPQFRKDVSTMHFNYFRDGELINVKYRGPQKSFKLYKDAELIFFNLDSIANQKECIITEGEPDAMSYHEIGLTRVISVPNGASKGSLKLEYLDNCIDYFEGIEKIYIATDADEPGQKLAKELVRRLGSERCYKVKFHDGCKDANETLVKEGRTALRETITRAEEWPLYGVINPSEVKNDLDSLFDNGLPEGMSIGLDPKGDIEDNGGMMIDDGGRVAVVTGIPGSGKSEFVDHITQVLEQRYGWRAAYASPENTPPELHMQKHISRLVGRGFSHIGKIVNGNPMTREEYVHARDYIFDNYSYIDCVKKKRSLDDVLKIAEDLIKRKGIRTLVIDPFNRVHDDGKNKKGITDYTGDYMEKLTFFAKKHRIFVILVAHPRKMDKMDGKFDVPSAYDIKGGGEFYDMSDFIISVHRDRETKTVEIHIQKVKFKHLGDKGQIDMTYDFFNNRYTRFGEHKDQSNWISKCNSQLEMHGYSDSSGIEPNRDFDMASVFGEDSEEVPF